MTQRRSKTTQTGKKAVRRRPTQKSKVAERKDEKKPRRRADKDSHLHTEGEPKSPADFRSYLLDAAFSLAKKTGASKILIFKDALGGNLKLITQRKTDQEVILVTKEESDLVDTADLGIISEIITVPRVNLTRTGQIKVALLNALVSGAIQQDERVVALSGPASPGNLDTLMVVDLNSEIEMFAFNAKPLLEGRTSPDVFEAFLGLAIEIAHQGREGKPIGTIFVIGDHENVLQLSRQMIINPFKGYSDEKCSIFNTDMRKTIREFAALDGAFIVREDGVVLAAGRLLSTTASDGDVPRGLGTRHAAGAGITASTEAIAITISETDSSVRIFKEGRVLTSITKPVV